MTRKATFLERVAILLMLMAPTQSLADLYQSKEECLRTNSGPDLQMVEMLCSSLVYPPTEKEKLEALRQQRERDRRRQKAYEESLQQRREEAWRNKERDPDYRKQNAEKERLDKCRFARDLLKQSFSEYSANGKKISPNSYLMNAQLPPECRGLIGL